MAKTRLASKGGETDKNCEKLLSSNPYRSWPGISSPESDSAFPHAAPGTPVLNDDETLTVFAVNRSLDEALPLRIELRGFEGTYAPFECVTMSHPDPKATNTEENPGNVKPHAGTADIEDGALCACLDPLSWNVIRLRRQA